MGRIRNQPDTFWPAKIGHTATKKRRNVPDIAEKLKKMSALTYVPQRLQEKLSKRNIHTEEHKMEHTKTSKSSTLDGLEAELTTLFKDLNIGGNSRCGVFLESALFAATLVTAKHISRSSFVKAAGELRSSINAFLDEMWKEAAFRSLHGKQILSLMGLENMVGFECKLAHGSPTGRVGAVKRIDQLYQTIADCYAGVHVDDILYCTVNTHQVDMTRLLSGRIDKDDLIFAHVKGTKTELEFVKKSPNLGLTISDNGVGKCFIKKIVEGSLGQTLQPAVTAGDVIAKINGISTVGMRHFEVAKMLRALPLNEMIKLRVIKPLQSGFSFVSSRRASGSKQAVVVGDGLETLRFKSTGKAVVQMAPSSLIIERLNAALEKYLGKRDDDLALTVWELCKDLSNSAQLLEAVDCGILAEFRIPQDLFSEMWGVVSDWKAGRLLPTDH